MSRHYTPQSFPSFYGPWNFPSSQLHILVSRGIVYLMLTSYTSSYLIFFIPIIFIKELQTRPCSPDKRVARFIIVPNNLIEKVT